MQTIYNAVGNKAAVLSAVLDVAASGPNAPTPVPEFMAERTAPHRCRRPIDLLADWLVEANERTATIHWIIRQAAAVDEDAAELERNAPHSDSATTGSPPPRCASAVAWPG